MAARLAHRAVHLGEHLLAAHAQLVLEVDVAGGDEGVDARIGGPFQGLSAALDVGRAGAGQAADLEPADLAGDGAHGLEVALAGDGEARLQDVHAQALELAGQRQLLGQVHAAAGRLLAVAQGGVEDADGLAAHGVAPGVGSGSGPAGSGSFSRVRGVARRQAHSTGPENV